MSVYEAPEDTQRFDFVVPASKTQPERIITTLNQPTKQNVQSAIFPSYNMYHEPVEFIGSKTSRRHISAAYA